MLKDILKGFALASVIVCGVVLFQYLGEDKLDIFVVVLFSLFIFCTAIIFYESAIRKNYRLFFVVLFLTIIFSSFFIYRKIIISKDKKLCTKVVLMNRELRDHEIRYNKLTLEEYKFDNDLESGKEKDKPNDKKTQRIETSIDKEIIKINDEIKNFTEELKNGISLISKHRKDCMKILADVHVSLISKSKKIDVMKCLDNYSNYKEDIESKYTKLKEKHEKLKKNLDDLVKKRNDEINKIKAEKDKAVNENQTIDPNTSTTKKNKSTNVGNARKNNVVKKNNKK